MVPCARCGGLDTTEHEVGDEKVNQVTSLNPTRPICNVCGCGTVVSGAGKKLACGHTDVRFEASGERTRDGVRRAACIRNDHPTVKPVEIMRWLVRLVTPPGGTVCDPFLGSGTTGCAAAIEGFEFVGIEQDERAAQIAMARIGFWAEHGAEALEIARRDRQAEPEPPGFEQLGLLA